MVQHVVWAEWPDLVIPAGMELIRADLEKLTDDQLGRITCYVAPYLSGRRGLEPTRRMPNLKVLQVPNAGYDDALEYLRPGVILCNARGVHDESTAELAVALTLAARRGFAAFGAAQRDHEWRRTIERSLTDSKVAVIGHGSIGRTIVRMLQGFSVTVTPFSRRGTDGARPVAELRGALHDFGIVILVLPLTEESAGMVDADFLAAMPDGAVLVNVARGPIVDTDALVRELASGRLRAGLDVTDPEPLPADHPLWSAPNCVITPHVGGNTSAFEPRMRALIQQQLTLLARGEDPVNIVARG